MRRALFVMLLSLGACNTVPITGREQLSLVSDSAVEASADAYARRFLATARQRGTLITGAESPQMATALASVQRAAARVIDASGLRDKRTWEVHLVRSDVANAWVVPSGKIVVFTGLLPMAKTEAALASVIGHEVGHVIARHTAERMSHELAARIAIEAAGALASAATKDRAAGAGLATALGFGLQYGLLLPYSREHESEADHIGVFLAAKAGYDPAEFAGIWRRMAANQKTSQWEFTSTHPAEERRFAQITAWMPEAMLYYADPMRPLPATLTEVSAARTARAEAAALAPLGMKPVWEDGWRYQIRRSDVPGGDRTIRIEHRTACPTAPPCLALLGEGGEESIYSTEFALAESRSPGGATRFDPPMITAQFPLRVGDSWSQRITISGEARHDAVAVKSEVVAFEPVTVPAGTFAAFKIVQTLDGRRSREAWWTPETRVPAKVILHDLRGRATTFELAAFPQSDDPTGVFTTASAD